MRTGWVVVLGVLLVGCGPAPATAPASEPAPASSWLPPAARAGPPPPATERAAVAAAYGRFWSTVYGLDDQPLDRWPALLAAVTADPLLPKLLKGMRAQRSSGVREYGSVVPRPVTVDVRGDVASLLDCQDASGAGEAYVDSGLPKTVGQARMPFAAALRRGADGRWRVSEARQLDGGC